jgi:hypothetical protein
MNFCVTILGVPKILFISYFCVTMSGFIYHYLASSLYVFAISVVILENDLGNKIIHVLSLSNTLFTQFFPYYHLII